MKILPIFSLVVAVLTMNIEASSIVSVRGRLMCNGRALDNTKVKLRDENEGRYIFR